nr:N-acetylmuramoyl-L-alanine amidase [uncultured Blautia sp.]
MKKHFAELIMAFVMLICFYLLSGKAADTAREILNPSSQEKLILVDAGHGGADPGMVGIGELKEKDINLQVSMKLKSALEERGFTVIMTRESDTGLYEKGTVNLKAQDLQNRIGMIRKYQPALSISVHQNSYSDGKVCGPQVFYYEDSREGEELADAIQNQLNEKLQVERPREIKGNRSYYMLKRSPGIINIVECGFLTNPGEAELLQTEEYQQKVADAIAEGVVTYLNGNSGKQKYSLGVTEKNIHFL